jgi:hypothetical protein
MRFFNYTGKVLAGGIGKPSSKPPDEQFSIPTGYSEPIGDAGLVNLAVYVNSKGTQHLIGTLIYADIPSRYIDLTVSAPPAYLGRENFINLADNYVFVYYSIEPDNITRLLGAVPLGTWNDA